MSSQSTLETLRRRIETIERTGGRRVGTGAERLTPTDRVLAGRAPAGPKLGLAAIDDVFPYGGLGFGVHEIAGDTGGAAGAFAMLLSARLVSARLVSACPAEGRHGSNRASWLVVQERAAVQEGGRLFGPGMLALGLDPDRVGLVVAKDETQALRIADEAARSAAVSAVLVELRRGDLLMDLSLTQRFNCSTQDTMSAVIFLSRQLQGASAALTRWRVETSPSREPNGWVGPPRFQLDLVRNRRGRPGRWIVEWSSDEQAFYIPASLSASVASEPAHGPGAPGARGFTSGAGPNPPGPDRQGQRRLAAAGA